MQNDLEAAVHAAMVAGVTAGVLASAGSRGMTKKQIKKRVNRIMDGLGCPMDLVTDLTQQFSEVAALEKMLEFKTRV